jgi:hypothetical protein
VGVGAGGVGVGVGELELVLTLLLPPQPMGTRHAANLTIKQMFPSFHTVIDWYPFRRERKPFPLQQREAMCSPESLLLRDSSFAYVRVSGFVTHISRNLFGMASAFMIWCGRTMHDKAKRTNAPKPGFGKEK